MLALLLVGCLPSCHGTALRGVLEPAKQHTYHDEIPRIVHLITLKPAEESEMEFSFQSFLCMYSAYQFIQPSVIFIHTDYSQSEVHRAIRYGSSWTRKILTTFSDTVKINHITPPTSTANGLPFDFIEHKLDFIRMEQMAIYGGIYLDWDVLTLRSPLPLLRAGFAAIVGRQVDGNINNGCFMAKKTSALVQLMIQDMPTVFTGERQTHSTGLITSIAERIAYVPGEVLIMDYKAFAPTDWSDERSTYDLFSERRPGEKLVTLGEQANVATLDALDRWNKRAKGASWEMDFSQTYFLHAFSPAGKSLPRFEGITVPYILRRRSNYALAAWPLVMQGTKEGLIDERDGILPSF
ncbi:hypothetical protein M406DRAFT_260439 [Cryphonectria parasitica EP155]|uniref:Glycosyl transferase n=1 Tax=Cryphonectria parasitica (strain ATCC 38755 / EP155) TaxID=660469 RepID=A0A9P4Y1E9_CRYP1|nr:uncharacterized protein M406DRAFT_260439 [Cryphonectria parasitica EP155]KAF3764744.1 hypothetical protein M406DRAFT_260439 [Cryphonectria parasitica EP155]